MHAQSVKQTLEQNEVRVKGRDYHCYQHKLFPTAHVYFLQPHIQQLLYMLACLCDFTTKLRLAMSGVIPV